MIKLFLTLHYLLIIILPKKFVVKFEVYVCIKINIYKTNHVVWTLGEARIHGAICGEIHGCLLFSTLDEQFISGSII